MTAVDDRLETERRFHDRQAAERAAAFRTGRAGLQFTDDDWLDHESWIRPAFARLGCVRGRHVLDLGCGHGMAAVVLARRGAAVTAIDLSPGYVAEARARAAANGVAITTHVADAESLPLPDQSIDAVWGNAILHHLNLHAAARELKRVLRPGGVAVFCEPWGGNPLIRFARCWLPYRGKHRTPDERPLERHDIALLRTHFPSMRTEGCQLLGMLRRLHPRLAPLGRVDQAILARLPRLQKFTRYLVLELRND